MFGFTGREGIEVQRIFACNTHARLELNVQNTEGYNSNIAWSHLAQYNTCCYVQTGENC